MERMVLDDTTVVTYLDIRGFKVTPIKTERGFIEFEIEGDGIAEALRDLYDNSPVGVLAYIKTFKALRSAIFAMKGGRR